MQTKIIISYAATQTHILLTQLYGVVGLSSSTLKWLGMRSLCHAMYPLPPRDESFRMTYFWKGTLAPRTHRLKYHLNCSEFLSFYCRKKIFCCFFALSSKLWFCISRTKCEIRGRELPAVESDDENTLSVHCGSFWCFISVFIRAVRAECERVHDSCVCNVRTRIKRQKEEHGE